MARFALVLHAHLPYVRAHGMWPFGEETLYEAMAETYLPLIRVLERLRAEGVEAPFTLGITPILAEQLADPRIKEGFWAYAKDRLERAQGDYQRYRGTALEASARHQVAFWELTLDHFQRLSGPRSRPGSAPTAATSPRTPRASGSRRWPTGPEGPGSPPWKAPRRG